MSTGNLSLFWTHRLNMFVEQCKVIRHFYFASMKFACLDLAMGCQYLFTNPYRMCRIHFQKNGEKNVHAYGETPLTLWRSIAELAEISRTDRFVDLGCGRGRVCFWTHHWIGCPTTGVDWVPQFIQKAQKLATPFKLSSIQFVSEKISDADLQSASVLYLYTFHPDEEVIDFQKLRSGSRVITVSEPLKHDGFVVQKSMQAQFPWGSTDVYINEKL
jgi:hypothetical protein